MDIDEFVLRSTEVRFEGRDVGIWIAKSLRDGLDFNCVMRRPFMEFIGCLT
jgi:hypothetical protein